MSQALAPELLRWLDAHALALDQGAPERLALLRELGKADVFRIGVDTELGGVGGSLNDALEAIASVARHSLTAAFVCWGHRAFIEYLLQSDNDDLRQRQLPDLLGGHRAGATGLSNAMKYLGGIESLQVKARPEGSGWRLDGALHWVTNLHPQGFSVAVAVARADGGAPFVAAVDSASAGVTRTPDLSLLALQGSNTAALRFEEVSSDPAEWISDDAHAFLPRVRPAFLGLQCGLAIGLARASLDQALASAQASRHSEVDDVCDLRRALEDAVSALHQGLASGHFKSAAADLFRLRIHLAELAQEAVSRELTCCGGKAYLQPQGGDFARRWREAAFVPIVTPSLSQLRGQLRSLPSEASKSHLVHRREAA